MMGSMMVCGGAGYSALRFQLRYHTLQAPRLTGMLLLVCAES